MEAAVRVRGTVVTAGPHTAAPPAADALRPLGAVAAPRTVPAVAALPTLADVVALLARVPMPPDGPGLIDQIGGLEDLKCMAGAKQAETAVAFDLCQRREQAAAGVPADEQGAGVAVQIALARRESPANGGRLLGLAKALTGMPHTFAAFRSGALSEWRATLVVKETICLTPEDRAAVDEELAADTGTLDGAGDRAIIAAVRAAAYRRDPASVTRRASRAVSERCVSLRPAPDTMAYLTALLPAAQGVAAYAALSQEAGTARSGGDDRSRGQVMADTLVERVTGTPGGISGVEIQLVMTDRTLLQADAEPARIPGYGTIPAATARILALTGKGDTDKELDLFLRRLYTAPATGELVAMDSRARLFPPGLKRFLQVRDDTCRTPYCDAPIRHHDHVISWHTGGLTNAGNGQGLCEACNHTKETPGWTTKPEPGPRHTVKTTTPTGHTYRSMAPPLPGTVLTGPDQQQYAACPSPPEQAQPPNAVHILGRVIPPRIHGHPRPSQRAVSREGGVSGKRTLSGKRAMARETGAP